MKTGRVEPSPAPFDYADVLKTAGLARSASPIVLAAMIERALERADVCPTHGKVPKIDGDRRCLRRRGDDDPEPCGKKTLKGALLSSPESIASVAKTLHLFGMHSDVVAKEEGLGRGPHKKADAPAFRQIELERDVLDALPEDARASVMRAQVKALPSRAETGS